MKNNRDSRKDKRIDIISGEGEKKCLLNIQVKDRKKTRKETAHGYFFNFCSANEFEHKYRWMKLGNVSEVYVYIRPSFRTSFFCLDTK